MTIKEVVNNAKYIQFPYNNEEYKDYYNERNPLRLPIIKDEEVLYTGMPKGNGHHYTTKYTYTYVLPAISKLLDFKFSMNDFKLVKVINGKYDVSYIKPKKKESYTVFCFDTGNGIRGNYDILLNPEFFKEPLYRELYRYPHRCSRIINNTTRSTRKLMISGDSQMIPSIAPLAHYFKEVWYFDNRTGWIKNKVFTESKFVSFRKNYKNVIFTDVLIECYCRDLNWYEYWNLQ